MPFDLDHLKAKGSPVPLFQGGWLNRSSGAGSIAFSENGVLVYSPEMPLTLESNTLAWMDRHGAIQPLIDTMRAYYGAALSPDGQKLALYVWAANDDIWVYHIVRGTLTRLTFGGSNSFAPVWSPDGRYIVYGSERETSFGLFRKPWDGSGAEERLTTPSRHQQIAESFTHDATMLSFDENRDIWILPLDGERKPWPFIQSPAYDGVGMFSPDGRWMAYRSDESGNYQIYVTSFPKHEGKWQISTDGGRYPIWSRDGKELLYLNGTVLMSVKVSYGQTIDFSAPRRVCELPQAAFDVFDISPDGQRFIVGLAHSKVATSSQINVVTDWFEDLRKTSATEK